MLLNLRFIAVVAAIAGAGTASSPSGGFGHIGVSTRANAASSRVEPSREVLVHTFQGYPDGGAPHAGLYADETGALYGTTETGGIQGCGSVRCGTVFKLTRAGTRYSLTVLHSFRGYPDAATPWAGLIGDKTGALYGTTMSGGAFRNGTVFKLTPSGSRYSESILYSFHGTPDGGGPAAGLIIDATGALFGTTYWGGASGCSCGVVFKLTPTRSTYTFSILHTFGGHPDGNTPFASLIADKTGALYGTTVSGGSSNKGSVFKLTPSGKVYGERIVHSFQSYPNDGAQPAANLIADGTGTLYGTTAAGGATNQGAVFKMTRSGADYTVSVIYSFRGYPTDGALSVAGLVEDNAGAFYGTTWAGGSSTCNRSGPQGCGTVFKLKPSATGYTESVLHSFRGGRDGKVPVAGLIVDKAAAIYGTTRQGGVTTDGTVFRVNI